MSTDTFPHELKIADIGLFLKRKIIMMKVTIDQLAFYL